MDLISVLLPAHNPGRFLVPAIQSILNQTHTNFELLVMDDGSTDGAVQSAQSVFNDDRIRWYFQDNAGKSVALNRLLGNAKGGYYLIQDADDISFPNRLERLLAAMQSNLDLAAVFSGHELILNEAHVAPTGRAKGIEECRWDIERMAMPAHDPTAMYRMSLVRGIEYEPSLRQGQGFDYILRVGERMPMIVIGECLYSYRVHFSSNTRQDPVRRQQFVQQVIHRARERRGGKLTAEAVTSKFWQSAAALRDNGVAAHFVQSVQDQLDDRARISAIQTGLQCASLHPFDPTYLKALVCAISPVRLGRRRRPFTGSAVN